MRVRRIDFVTTLAAPVRRADGTVVVEARIARTGVQTYRNADGSTRIEYRPDAEVTRSMQSMRLVPLTNQHPPVMLDSGNAKTYAIGAVGENIRRDGEWIVAPLAVHDGNTVKQMDAGLLRQVSAGYECEIDETPGTFEGVRYDAIQRAITINHVALVSNARAGRDAAVRMDAAINDEENPMPDMTADEQVRALKLRCDEADKTLTERKDALDTTTAERDALKGKVATLETQVTTLTAQIAAGAEAMQTEAIAQHAAARKDAEDKLASLQSTREAEIRKAAEVRIKAKAVMGSEFRLDGMPDRVIQCAVIKKFAPKEDVGEHVSAAYISSRFDSLVEAFTANARSLTRVSEVIAPNASAARVDTREARAKAWHEQALNGGYRPGHKE